MKKYSSSGKRRFSEKLEVLELVEVPVQVVDRLADDLEHPIKEAAADDRGGLEDGLEIVIQPVDPRHDDALQGVGDGNLVEILSHPPLC